MYDYRFSPPYVTPALNHPNDMLNHTASTVCEQPSKKNVTTNSIEAFNLERAELCFVCLCHVSKLLVPLERLSKEPKRAPADF